MYEVTVQTSEAYGKKIAGSNSQIPMAWGLEDAEGPINFYIAKPFSNEDQHLVVTSIQCGEPSLETALAETFDQSIIDKIIWTAQEVDTNTNAGLKAVSDWWEPKVPKPNGQLP